MSHQSLLDGLASELCPQTSPEFSDSGWKCAKVCKACRRETIAVLTRLATEARLQGLPVAADWMDEIANAVPHEEAVN